MPEASSSTVTRGPRGQARALAHPTAVSTTRLDRGSTATAVPASASSQSHDSSPAAEPCPSTAAPTERPVGNRRGKQNAPAQVVLAIADVADRAGLRAAIEGLGDQVIGDAGAADAGLALARKLEPDLLVLDTSLLSLGILSEVQEFQIQRIAALVLRGPAVVDGARLTRRIGAFGWLPADNSADQLAPAIEIAVRTWRNQNVILGLLAKKTRELEGRIVVERAKGILMEREPGLKEREAFERIRTFAMRNRLSKVRVAEMIVFGDLVFAAAESNRGVEG